VIAAVRTRVRRRTSARATVQRRERTLIGAIIATAALLRLPGLLGDGVWRDQANVWVQLSAPDVAEYARRVIATEWHPPLFFALAWCWSKIAGRGEFALESLPFVCSIATVWLVYRLGREIGGVRTGAIAAGFYAVAPLTIAYSSEYLYPQIGLASTLLALLVVRARNRRLTMRCGAELALATSAVVFTHYTGLLFVPLLMLFALMTTRGRRGPAVAGALLAGALPFAAWLPIFLMQRRIGIPYRSTASVGERVNFFMHAVSTFVPVRPLAMEFAFGLVLSAALAVIAFADWSGVPAHRPAGRNNACPALALGAVFVAMLVLNTAQNLTESRYVLPYFGAACASAAWILARAASVLRTAFPQGWKRWGGATALTLAALLVGLDVVDAVAAARIPKSGIRTIVHTPRADAQTLYVIAPDYLGSTFAFYARDSRVAFAGFVRWDRPEIFRLAGYAADWNRRDAVARTLERIARAPARVTVIDVVVDDRARDAGSVPYGRVHALLAELRTRYRLLDQTPHPGRYEAVTEDRFARDSATARM
jgi:hypothetical protein